MMYIKKITSSILTVVLSVLLCCSCSGAEAASNEDFGLTMQIGNPVMTVNGAEQNIDENGTAPLIRNGVTLVPIRAIIEAMGGSVSWDQTSETASLEYNGDKIDLTIGSETAYLNGEANTLDTAPAVINSRTMLPIRFIAEGFRFDVEWESGTQTITVRKQVSAVNEAAVTKTQPEEVQPQEGKKALVVYYSATGSTKEAAEYIAEAVNGDIFEIEPVDPYTSEDLSWTNENSRVSVEHENEDERDVELVSTAVPDWESYDTVFIGYPIWWGIAAWPVNGFVEANDFTGKTIIPFCTSASSGLGESGELLEEIAGTGNWTEGERFSSGVSESDVKEWAEEVINSIENN